MFGECHTRKKSVLSPFSFLLPLPGNIRAMRGKPQTEKEETTQESFSLFFSRRRPVRYTSLPPLPRNLLAAAKGKKKKKRRVAVGILWPPLFRLLPPSNKQTNIISSLSLSHRRRGEQGGGRGRERGDVTKSS